MRLNVAVAVNDHVNDHVNVTVDVIVIVDGDGDEVMSINGANTDSASHPLEELRKQGRTTVLVRLKRRGRVVTLTYHIK